MTGQLVAVVAAALLVAPGVALALQLDLERADARRRTRRALAGRRERLQAVQSARRARRFTTAEQLADLSLRLDHFAKAVGLALLPWQRAALQAALELDEAARRVAIAFGKRRNR